MSGGDAALARFAAFVASAPAVGILSRNLLFLPGGRGGVDSVEINAGLKCYTAGRGVVIGGAAYLLRGEFSEEHWLAALRVLLAREVQHAASSDKAVQARVKLRFSALMAERYGAQGLLPVITAGRMHAILEDGRMDNLVCARLPGYIPMTRFTNYARCRYARERAGASDMGAGKLERLVCAVESRALTGLVADGLPADRASEILRLTDAAVLAPTAADCGERAFELLALCADIVAAAARYIADEAESSISPEDIPPDYARDAGEREEQEGDGSDSGFRGAETLPAERLEQVLGAGKSARAEALTESETAELLFQSVTELERERELEKAGRVASPEASALSKGELGSLKSRYAGVSYTERALRPGSARLPETERDKAARLHGRLERMLREQRLRREGERMGAVSMKSLWKVGVNDDDVFSRKTAGREYGSAFFLLIDKSGSMGTGYERGESKLTAALKNAAVIEEALKGIAYTKIVAFDGGTDSVEHVVIKDFAQKELGNRCMDALGALLPGNGNKDGYSIRSAALELAKRRERRKILVLLSDGLPSGYRGEREAVSDLRSAVLEARAKGILVIPIVYGGADMEKSLPVYRQMYEKGVLCASQSTLLDEFEKLLLSLIA